MKRIYILCVLVILISHHLVAEQITTVAVINIPAVMEAFPSEARGYENLSELKKRYQNEINDQIDKLNALKREKALAMKDEDYDRATSLDSRINNLANYITTLSEQRQRDLTRRSQSPVSKAFLNKLQDAISYVSEEKGYTLVLQSTMDGIQWWAPVIDITDDVIKRLREK